MGNRRERDRECCLVAVDFDSANVLFSAAAFTILVGVPLGEPISVSFLLDKTARLCSQERMVAAVRAQLKVCFVFPALSHWCRGKELVIEINVLCAVVPGERPS